MNDLIGAGSYLGTQEYLRGYGFPGATAPAWVVQPSLRGVRLYLWAAGLVLASQQIFLNPPVDMLPDATGSITLPANTALKADHPWLTPPDGA